jgi:hypothetical protein
MEADPQALQPVDIFSDDDLDREKPSALVIAYDRL